MLASLGIPALLVIVVAAAVWLHGSRHRSRAGAAPSTAMDRPEPASEIKRPARVPAMAGARGSRLADELGRWTGAGLITPSESEAIVAFEESRGSKPEPVRAVAGRPRKIPAAAEAMGYLGGALVVIGMTLTATRFWAEFSISARLMLTGVVAIVLMVAGALIHEAADPALARFRWFIWLASSAVTGVFFGVLGMQQIDLSLKGTILLTAAAIALQSGLLWWWKQRPVQQIVTLGAILVAVTALAAVIFAAPTQGPMGMVLWLVGAAYVAVAFRRWTPDFQLTRLAGAVATVVAGVFVVNAWQGEGGLFLMADGVAVLALAEIRDLLPGRGDRLVLGAVGAVGIALAISPTFTYYSPAAAIVAGCLVWLAGAVVLVLGFRNLVMTPRLAQAVGGAALVAAGAITANQSEPFALACGVVTSVLLVGLGTRPGMVLMSAFGSVGLLVYVTWSVNYFFPGQAQAPVVIMVAGLLVIGVAVWMARLRGRFASELRRRDGRP